MVQQYFKDLEVVVAQHGVMKCRLPPSGPLIRVNTTFEQPLNPLIIVPVGLAEQNHPEALLVELPALHEDLQGGVVLRFRRMIWRFLVVRIRAALEQQAGQLRRRRRSRSPTPDAARDSSPSTPYSRSRQHLAAPSPLAPSHPTARDPA